MDRNVRWLLILLAVVGVVCILLMALGPAGSESVKNESGIDTGTTTTNCGR